VYLAGVLIGKLGSPLVLLREAVTYYKDLYLPGFRGGRFELAKLFFDLPWKNSDNLLRGSLFLLVRVPPRRVVTAVVGAGVVFVLGEHLYVVFTSGTDFDEVVRLCSIQREYSGELCRLTEARKTWWENNPHPDPAVRAMLEEGNKKLDWTARRMYRGVYNMEYIWKTALPATTEYGIPTHRPTLLERGVAQGVRLCKSLW